MSPASLNIVQKHCPPYHDIEWVSKWVSVV